MKINAACQIMNLDNKCFGSFICRNGISVCNVKTFQEPEGLTDADTELLMRACEAFKKQVSIPCTACRYCCDDCPMKIDIPAYLDVYNSYKTDGSWALNRMGNIESAGKPSNCIGCGACVGHCPQSIQIPEIMSELAELSK